MPRGSKELVIGESRDDGPQTGPRLEATCDGELTAQKTEGTS